MSVLVDTRKISQPNKENEKLSQYLMGLCESLYAENVDLFADSSGVGKDLSLTQGDANSARRQLLENFDELLIEDRGNLLCITGFSNGDQVEITWGTINDIEGFKREFESTPNGIRKRTENGDSTAEYDIEEVKKFFEPAKWKAGEFEIE